MRSATFSSLAILASSLLVKEALAGRYDVRKRAKVTELVVISEEVYVTAERDGSFKTGAHIPVATVTIHGSAGSAKVDHDPVEVNKPVAVPVQANQPVADATTSAKAVQKPTQAAGDNGAAFAEKPKPDPPSTHTPKKTTLATVKAPAAPTPSAPSNTSPSSGVKRGIAYNDQSLLSAFTSSGKFGWVYNWGSAPQYNGATIPSGLEFVPMLWGNTTDYTQSWVSNAEKAIASGSKHLLAFNEPDRGDQANIDPVTAATGYKKYMEPFAGKAQLGSPAVTSDQQDPTKGIPWLKRFLSACDGCTIDFINIHWYGGGDLALAVKNFQDQVQAAYKAGGSKKPIWVTEFRYEGADANGFLKQVIPWLDSQASVERYAYFMAAQGFLTDGKALSTTGKTYVSL
ncbi:uncharacterized protein BP5553_02890 [Venustampulla echinocandica]|uniref:Asl1-like glycosyl hydrolase catalytic domain-containing protein n=1 Tax=Venustampulla echinocandica TaxID=2656787 RepID=A0A370TSP5_9HELO|nr:uncharacterized protein BP5553_02890 [Venustampulla echinocandica]RDL38550.1 hypothetical protein BP5553_02890 [Venustampulla echinocandica]